MTSRVLLATTCMVLAACGGGDGGEASVEATSPTTAPPSPTSGVSVVDTSLGPVLADADGNTIYGFTVDDPRVSNCYDACASIWPPVAGDTPISDGLDASLFSVIERDDGTSQLVIGDWPLYLYAGDGAPGDVNGQGVEGVWFVVDAEGNLVGAGEGADASSSENAPASPRDDYGYDY
jgi:predicted lipoprotein with Yx(FWY)xxD motif